MVTRKDSVPIGLKRVQMAVYLIITCAWILPWVARNTNTTFTSPIGTFVVRSTIADELAHHTTELMLVRADQPERAIAQGRDGACYRISHQYFGNPEVRQIPVSFCQ